MLNADDIHIDSAYSPEERTNQIIALATNESERRIRDGSASDQLLIHYLKLATSREQLENEILAKQRELITAKTEAIQSVKKTEELYSNAIEAMKKYGGSNDDN